MEEFVKVSSRLCLIRDLGTNGNLFGGNMMAWIDEVAAIYAIQTTGETRMSTVHYSEMTFKYPVREGDIVDFYCGRVRRGTTSVVFEIKAICRGVTVFGADCVFVAVDAAGCKKKIDWK